MGQLIIIIFAVIVPPDYYILRKIGVAPGTLYSDILHRSFKIFISNFASRFHPFTV